MADKTTPVGDMGRDPAPAPDAEQAVARVRELAAAPEVLARFFHEAYERLAPIYGYETRRESAVPWEDVPEQNRLLMTAVCAEVGQLFRLALRGPAPDAEQAVARVLALAEDCERWAAVNEDLAHWWSGQSDDVRNFHEGLRQAWFMAARRIRAAVKGDRP